MKRDTLIILLLAVVMIAPSAAAHFGGITVAADDANTTALKSLLPKETPIVLPAGYGPAQSASAQAGDYQITFRCPAPVTEDGAPTAAVSCPYYLLDQEDIMGQPIMVMDPTDSNLIAFSALHGGRGLHPLPDNQPPTDRSRMDSIHQPHTTFRTTDGGVGWEDMPYYAPDSLRKDDGSRQIFGEDNTVVLDSEGRMYISAMYAYRDGASATTPASGPFNYAVNVWKANRINRAVDYYVNTRIINTGNEGTNQADSLHSIYVRDTNKVAVLWRESVFETGLTDAVGTGPSSFIELYWTNPKDGAMWNQVDSSQRIGPCSSITNPVTFRKEIFIGCYPAAGYEGNAGSLQMHAIDTDSWTTRHVSSTPIYDDAHTLLINRGTEGNMVLITSGLTGNGGSTVKLSYGEAGERWSSPQDYGDDLTSVTTSPLKDARVTAAAFVPKTGNIHLLYLERYDVGEPSQDQVDKPEYTKILASIRAEASFQSKEDLLVGRVNRVEYSPTFTGFGSGAFDDIHDSIIVWTDPDSGDSREYIAFGDYGYVRFGEIVEQNPLPPLAFGGTPVPPVPLATAGTNPALYGAAAGLLSSAMVARLLLAKKKTTVEAPTE